MTHFIEQPPRLPDSPIARLTEIANQIAQSKTDSIEAIPIVSNNNNFAKGSGATLLSFDDGVTLFHEAG